MDKTFQDSYRSTQWQEKKNRILTRDNYTCAVCGKHGDEHTLMHVHHKTYEHCVDNKCWTCPDDDLITLCEGCHAKLHGKDEVKLPLLPNYVFLRSIDDWTFVKACITKNAYSREGYVRVVLYALRLWANNNKNKYTFRQIKDPLLEDIGLFAILANNGDSNEIMYYAYHLQSFGGSMDYGGTTEDKILRVWQRDYILHYDEANGFTPYGEYKVAQNFLKNRDLDIEKQVPF